MYVARSFFSVAVIVGFASSVLAEDNLNGLDPYYDREGKSIIAERPIQVGSKLFVDNFNLINNALWNYSSAWTYSEKHQSTAQFNCPIIINGALSISTLPDFLLEADDNAYFGVRSSSKILKNNFLLRIRVRNIILATAGNGDYDGTLQFRLEDIGDWMHGNDINVSFSKAQANNVMYDVATLNYRKNGHRVPIGGNFNNGTLFMTNISNATGNTKELTLVRNDTTLTAWVGNTKIGKISKVTANELYLTLNPTVWNSETGAVQSFNPTVGGAPHRGHSVDPAPLVSG